MYEIPYPFKFSFLMLSSEVLEKLGFEKHIYPDSIEWTLCAKTQYTNKMIDFRVREIPPHVKFLNDIETYIGTEFILPRFHINICFLHDLLENAAYFDPGVMIVLEENAKKKDLFLYFINYFDYKFKHGRKTRPTPRWN